MNLMDNEKHYNTLDRYYKKKYGKKVAKVTLNANFSCPNKDGSKGIGGCIYCSKSGSGDFAGNVNYSLKEQFFQIKKIMDNKWKDCFYIPYFQANSNTYGNIELLNNTYSQVVDIDPNIVALAIATRCDCINEENAKYLGELNKKIPLSIELGLQSSNENTLQYLNTCYNKKEFIRAVKLLRSYDIEVVVHIINGLPYETKEDMLNTIDFINSLDIHGLKIHSLMILKNTTLAELYEKENFKMLTLSEYVDITCSQIERLSSKIILHRLSADGVTDDLIAPNWVSKKLVVMNEIDKEMRRRNTYQGDYL